MQKLAVICAAALAITAQLCFRPNRAGLRLPNGPETPMASRLLDRLPHRSRWRLCLGPQCLHGGLPCDRRYRQVAN